MKPYLPFALLCLMTSLAAAQQRADFKTAQKDTLYNKVVSDPYRLLEDTANAKVKAWMHKEADRTDAFLNAIPGRKLLFDKITEAYKNQKLDEIGSVSLYKGKFYVSKRMPGQENVSIYVIDKSGHQKLYLDPQKEHPEIKSKNISLAYFDFTDDHPYLTYDLIVGGDETAPRSYLRNLITKEEKPDSVYLVKKRLFLYFDPARKDAFYYLALPNLKKTGVDPIHWYDDSTVGYHVLGTDLSADKTVIGTDTTFIKRKPGNELDFILDKDLPCALAVVKNDVANEYRIHYILKKELNGTVTSWKMLTDFKNKVSAYRCFDKYLYMISKKDAPNGKVLRADLKDGNFTDMATLIPNSSRTIIKSINITKTALLVTVSTDGVSKLLSIAHGSRAIQQISLPLSGSLDLTWTDKKESSFIIQVTSWERSPEYFTYDPIKKRFSPSVIQTYHSNAAVPLETNEVMVKSYDGVMVPMTIIYKKGLVLNGKNPTWLTGYGAYGQNDEPGYWLEDGVFYSYGGVRAVAHVRGGGVYGEAWKLAGNKQTKPNTWKDFISCAEYLVAHKYATPKTLTGFGGSAGGITIGRAITERPDLFGTAFISVGALDMVRFEKSPNGFGNVPEFGSVATEKGFNALYEMSTYHHITDGVKYPAVIFSHGVNDNRVPVWTSLKTFARLQDATSSGNPILLKLDFDNGHGLQMTISGYINTAADKWAFAFARAGVPGFGPIPSNTP